MGERAGRGVTLLSPHNTAAPTLPQLTLGRAAAEKEVAAAAAAAAAATHAAARIIGRACTRRAQGACAISAGRAVGRPVELEMCGREGT